MSKKKKILIAVFILLAIAGIGFAIYYFAFGITPKQKYERCVKRCVEMVTQQNSKELCDFRCSEVTHYDPRFDDNKTETAPKRANLTKKSGDSAKDSSSTPDLDYYCEWSWPQKIIDYKTKAVIKPCSSNRPYCFKGDGTYEKMACCNYANEEYFDCVSLEDLLK